MSAGPDSVRTADDLPLLGETFAVELANTRYRSDRDDLDFLADAHAVATWFRYAPAAGGIVVPDVLSSGALAAIQRIRDATRLILAHIADDARSSTTAPAVEILHQEAQRADTHLGLDVSGDGTPTWCVHHEGQAEDVFLAAAASRCILFLGGADIGRVRRCGRTACPMFFVQRHRARRFCHESCAHSVRQARYYQSTFQRRQDQPARPPAE